MSISHDDALIAVWEHAAAEWTLGDENIYDMLGVVQRLRDGIEQLERERDGWEAAARYLANALAPFSPPPNPIIAQYKNDQWAQDWLGRARKETERMFDASVDNITPQT